MGGALGLAVIASLADARTAALERAGIETLVALNEGYRLAFVLGAVLTAAAAAVGAVLLRPRAGAEAESTVAATG